MTVKYGAQNQAMTRVQHFYDQVTSTFTYMVSDAETAVAAMIDPVLDLDQTSGTLGTQSADEVIEHIRDNNHSLRYILETHIHADHLSSAPYIRERLGGEIVIGSQITTVQETFATIFAEGDGFRRDGSQFDLMLSDGDTLSLGGLDVLAFHVPGHTPACMAYLIGDALFVGDTLFMPDAGTARCDFPGGDAKSLYESCQRLLTLPDDTRVFVCHDYQPGGRDLAHSCWGRHFGGCVRGHARGSGHGSRDANPDIALSAGQYACRQSAANRCLRQAVSKSPYQCLWRYPTRSLRQRRMTNPRLQSATRTMRPPHGSSNAPHWAECS